MSLRTLVDALDREVQLPAFQRDAAWDETRVELLWDSILRALHPQELDTEAVSGIQQVCHPTRNLGPVRIYPARLRVARPSNASCGKASLGNGSDRLGKSFS